MLQLIVLAVPALIAFITIRRLYFSPLSKFPGPKLAAATHLVDHYYELFHGEGGQFPATYREWHKKYGPIIRIAPDELHVQDSSWYEYFFSPTRPVRKVHNFGYRFGNEHTAFGAEDPDTYRQRRNALNPFFSKKRVQDFSPRIWEKADRLLERLDGEYLHEDKVLNVTKMWECFVADNADSFVFNRKSFAIESPGFVSKVNEATLQLTEATHWMSLPGVAAVVRSLPDSLVAYLSPEQAHVFAFWKDIENNISDAIERREKPGKQEETLFSYLLKEDVGSDEFTRVMLQQEARGVVGAGSETTARALSVATFHILDQSAVRDRLCSELQSASGDHKLSWSQLSQLPYLSGCVEEAIRLTYGVSERRARIYDKAPLTYGDWTIPPGTKVSMDNYDVSHDEQIFPDSHRFVPDRWLGEPKAPDGKQLNRYMVSFGKGMRNCVGFQVAYAEIFIGLAALFGSVCGAKARLYETDRSSLDMARCKFVPKPKKGTQGVRVVFQPDGLPTIEA